MKSPTSEVAKENENTLQNEADNNQGKLSNVETLSNSDNLCRENSRNSVRSDCTLNEEEKNIMTLSKDCMDKQQEGCVKELNEVIEPKSVEKVEYNLVS